MIFRIFAHFLLLDFTFAYCAGFLTCTRNSSSNVRVEHGNLLITVLQEDYSGARITSGNIRTRQNLRFNFKTTNYIVTIRASLPIEHYLISGIKFNKGKLWKEDILVYSSKSNPSFIHLHTTTLTRDNSSRPWHEKLKNERAHFRQWHTYWFYFNTSNYRYTHSPTQAYYGEESLIDISLKVE